MAVFKKFYKAVDKTTLPDLPATWKGQLYKCTLEIDANVDGALTKVPCNQIIKATNFSTNGLRIHIRDVHRKEFASVEGSAEEQGSGQMDIRAFGMKDEVDRQQREKVVLAFAQNGLPYQLVDDESFRDAFGVQIPRKMDRNELASATETLKSNAENVLLRRYFFHFYRACKNIFSGCAVRTFSSWWMGGP
eukprot:EG_transcript_2438